MFGSAMPRLRNALTRLIHAVFHFWEANHMKSITTVLYRPGGRCPDGDGGPGPNPDRDVGPMTGQAREPAG